jgi:hypothetical protein
MAAALVALSIASSMRAVTEDPTTPGPRAASAVAGEAKRRLAVVSALQQALLTVSPVRFNEGAIE